MPITNLLARKGRADKATIIRTKSLVQAVLGFGSAGYTFVDIAASQEPSLKGALLAMDGEIPKDRAQDDHVIVVRECPLQRLLERLPSVPLLAQDPWIRTLIFPAASNRGAGASKPVGHVKTTFELAPYAHKFAHIMNGQLMAPMGEERLVVNLHVVSSACGGMGPSVLIAAALIARDIVRRKAPDATCIIILHLLSVTLYDDQVTDPEEKNKLWANEYGTFLEVNYATDPGHVRTMARLLGLDLPVYPTFDQVVSYHQTDESGRCYTLEETLRERVLANVMSHADEALVGKLRERGANTGTMLAGLDRGVARRIVTACQAQTARVPSQLGPYWATIRARAEIAQWLGEPAEERVTELAALLKSSLRIEEFRSAIKAPFDAIKTDALVLPRTVRRHTPAQARAHLKEVFDRFASAVKEDLDTKQGQLLEHLVSVAIPEVLAGMTRTLSGKAKSIGEFAATFGRLRQMVSDLGQREGAEAEKAAETVRAKRDEFVSLLGRLTTQTFAGGLKVQATEVLNKTIEAELTRRRYRTFNKVLLAYEAALADAERDANSVRQALAHEPGLLEAESRRLGALITKQTGLSLSVIQPDEVNGVLAAVERALGATGNLPRLDVASLLADGPHTVGRHIDGLVAELTRRFDDYFSSQVGDVSGAVKTFRLKFSVEKFVERAVRSLACSSPIVPADGVSAEPKTVLIACGRDLEAAKDILARKPTLQQLEVAEGVDPMAITVHRRIEGLTVRSLPTFEDGKRAALWYPKPGTPGVSAWEALPPCGHLLGAYQQAGLVPEEWLTPPPQPQTQRRSVKPVNTNTNGDSL